MTFDPLIYPTIQCAGHKCPDADRENCKRYQRRDPKAPWASFDIERQRYPGPCIHRIVVRSEKKAV